MNNANQYHCFFKSIHWITALIVLGLLSVGFFMTSMEFSPLKLNIYMLHKSFGITILLLVIVRIGWRLFVKSPKPLDTHAKWEKILSKLTHFLLYYGLIAMPMSGWAMSNAGEYPVNFFGLFELPTITPKDEQTYKFLKEVHETGAFALIAAIGLHFLGAAKHHIIDKDETLRRMGGNLAFLIVGGFLLLVPTVYAGNHLLQEFTGEKHEHEHEHENEHAEEQLAPSDDAVDDESAMETDENSLAEAQNWAIDAEKSAINFQFTQYGKAVNGSFGSFSGDIIFDPEDLENASAKIIIDIPSIETGSADRDAQAKSGEWFAAEEYPQAIFETESFSESGTGQYVANGHLTIRGNKMPLELPFSLEINNNDEGQETAEMSAEITLNRLDFGIGQGQWETEEAIENAVKINISVSATKPE